jgi:hypothetical protein
MPHDASWRRSENHSQRGLEGPLAPWPTREAGSHARAAHWGLDAAAPPKVLMPPAAALPLGLQAGAARAARFFDAVRAAFARVPEESCGATVAPRVALHPGRPFDATQHQSAPTRPGGPPRRCLRERGTCDASGNSRGGLRAKERYVAWCVGRARSEAPRSTWHALR